MKRIWTARTCPPSELAQTLNALEAQGWRVLTLLCPRTDLWGSVLIAAWKVIIEKESPCRSEGR